MRTICAATSVLVALAAAPAARADQASGGQDTDFVRHAAAAGAAEVAAGRLAQAQASDPAVREFGRWMATDHTLVNQLLQTHAREAGLGADASAPAPTHALDALRSLHGRAFDDRYLAMQISDHEKAVDLFRREAKGGENAGLRRMAQHALPALQEHLAEARELQSGAQGNQASGQASSGGAPGTSTTQATTAPDQSAAVKQTNDEGAKRLETEGK